MSRRLLAPGVLVVCVVAIALGACPRGTSVYADGGPAIDEADDETNPLGPNAACYVCHMTFVREELTKTHLAVKVYCIDCHGLSAAHANDEDIGATKPDTIYAREQINEACRECHETHDVPPEDVIARWVEREQTEAPAVCTDCHGAHRLDAPLAQ